MKGLLEDGVLNYIIDMISLVIRSAIAVVHTRIVPCYSRKLGQTLP